MCYFFINTLKIAMSAKRSHHSSGFSVC